MRSSAKALLLVLLFVCWVGDVLAGFLLVVKLRVLKCNIIDLVARAMSMSIMQMHTLFNGFYQLLSTRSWF